MRFSLFLAASIVLIVFGIFAGAADHSTPPGTLFGVQWFIWFMASFLAYLADIAVGWGYEAGHWGRRGSAPAQQAPPVQGP
jgi:hypothetical protein